MSIGVDVAARVMPEYQKGSTGVVHAGPTVNNYVVRCEICGKFHSYDYDCEQKKV